MKKTAVLIDAENVSYRCIKPIFKELEEKKCDVKIKQAFGDWNGSHVTRGAWTETLDDYAIKAIHLSSSSNGKNAADIQVVIKGMELLFQNPEIEFFVIVSGDSDFTPFALYLKKRGKKVYGYGGRNSSIMLKKACNIFKEIDVDNFLSGSKEDEVRECFLNIWFEEFWNRNRKGWMDMELLSESFNQRMGYHWKELMHQTFKNLVKSLKSFEIMKGDGAFYVRPYTKGDNWIFLVTESAYFSLVDLQDNEWVSIKKIMDFIQSNYRRPKKLKQYTLRELIAQAPLYDYDHKNGMIRRRFSQEELELNRIFIEQYRGQNEKWLSIENEVSQDLANNVVERLAENELFNNIEKDKVKKLAQNCRSLNISGTFNDCGEEKFYIQEKFEPKDY